jgi:hypothetical protein
MISLFAANLPASVIFDNTYTWKDPNLSQFDLLSVKVTVSDSFQGNPLKEFWNYTVTNLNFFFPPAAGAQPVGIQFFHVLFGALRDPRDYALGDFSQPPGWENICGPICSGFPGGTIWTTSRNSWLSPGESGTFSFTLDSSVSRPPGSGTGPNTIVNSVGEAALFDPTGIFGVSGQLTAPGPPIPETINLGACRHRLVWTRSMDPK